MKKLLALILIVLFSASVFAGEEDNSNDNSGLIDSILGAFGDLADSVKDGISSIPEKLLDFVVDVINLPLQPLLFLVKKLLSEEVKIDFLKGIWSIIVYILSLLYGLLFIFSGINLMTSGNSAEKREKAKQGLQNTLLMIVFVQASFLIYQLLLSFTNILANSCMHLINDNFFVFTAENFANLGMNLFFGLSYIVALLIAVIILAIRYILVAFGVVAFPIAIFLYFFPYTKQYGKLILNILVVAAIMPFVNVLILLMGSQMLNIEVFNNLKILVMIASFFLVIIVNLMMFSFIISQSSSVLPEGSTKLLTMPIKGF